MNIGDILSGIKNLGTKAAGTVSSLLSSADKKIVQPAEKTLGDILSGNAVQGPAAATKTGIAINTVAGIPKGTVDVAKDIAKGAARFAVSAGEAIPEIPLEAYSLVTNKPSLVKPYEPSPIPGLGFLGPVESYQNEAKRTGASSVGDILKIGGQAVLDEPSGAAVKPLLLAAKPLGLAIGAIWKSGGAKEVETAINSLVKATTPEEVHSVLEGLGMAKKDIAPVVPALASAKTKEEVLSVLRGETAPAAKAPANATVASQGADETLKAAEIAQGTPKGVPGVKSVGELIAERGNGKIPPEVPRETGPIPGQPGPERRFITRTKAMAPEAQAMLDGKYKPRDTQELIDTADALIKSSPDAATRMAIEGTDDNAVAVASRLIDTYITDAKAAQGPAKDALYEKAAEIANAAAKTLTEHGRAVQAASILGRLTPEGMVRYAARQVQKYNEKAGERTVTNFLGGAKKIPELTGEQAKEIADEMEKIQAMTDPEQKARAFSDLSKKVRALIPSTLYAKIITLWKAGLLTGLKTTGLNIASNASHAAAETIKDVPAALVDRVAALFTGKRTLAATGKGIPSGTKEGIQKGWRFFRTGYDERDALEGLDFHQVNFGKGPIAKVLQKYEETIFNSLGSQDQPFYYGAKARSLYSQAIATAKNEGLKGPAYSARINELVANPTDQMLKYAVMDAQTAVFQNKTALGTAAKAIQRLPGGEVLLPFGKTPAAVATQLLNYTPVGIVKTIIENAGKGRFDQRLFSQGIGRGLTGTGVLAIGAALSRNGLLTGAYPTSEKEQKQWQLEGKIANAIKVGDTWRGVGVLGPLGMVLSVGGALDRGIKDTGSFIGGLGEAAAAGGNALTQQSFLYGINQAINALNDPSRYGAQFINNTIGSIIPTIVADVARATDTNERRTNTATQRLVSRIPGLRELLQPQVDTLGSKITVPDFITTMIDPTRPGNATQAPNDPVVKELRRLDDAGYNVTPTMLGTKQGFKTLSGPQNTDLWVKAGTAAKKAIADITKDSVYPTLDDEQKSKLIAKVVDDAEIQERAKAVVSATKGLKGKALDAKLKEMLDDKLLTKTVYKWYSALGGTGNYPLQ